MARINLLRDLVSAEVIRLAGRGASVDRNRVHRLGQGKAIEVGALDTQIETKARG